MKTIGIVSICSLLVLSATASAQIMQVHTKAGGLHEFNIANIDSLTFITEFLYSEDFSTGALGWQKIAGPGILEVVNGTFKHTTVAYSAWAEYAYTPRTFGNVRYELDVFVDSTTCCTAFSWRAPDLNRLTGSGGAYQARFNNSNIAPGPEGHFVVEKFDPAGRTVLLAIDNRYYGLNHLTIDDKGTSLTIAVYNPRGGSMTTTINVAGFSAVAPGYMVLTGGDYGGGDYFDNILVR